MRHNHKKMILVELSAAEAGTGAVGLRIDDVKLPDVVKLAFKIFSAPY